MEACLLPIVGDNGGVVTAGQLAMRLGVSGKAVRVLLRDRFPGHGRGERWVFSEAEAQMLVAEFGGVGFGEVGARRSSGRGGSDEGYVLDLCDTILGEVGVRQYRFDWLRGDPNSVGARARLPVDAFYPTCGLVVEFHERQHTEVVEFFDKPDQVTVSGVPRGEQRRRYDDRRRDEIPAHGLRLVEIEFSDLVADSAGRLRRDRAADLPVITELLG